MAENTTTTTTTTADVPEAHKQPTGDNASVNHPGGEASPSAERQGEVAIDKNAKTNIVGGVPSADDDTSAADRDSEVSSQNIEDAKADGLRNADREQQAQPRETGQPDRNSSDRKDTERSNTERDNTVRSGGGNKR